MVLLKPLTFNKYIAILRKLTCWEMTQRLVIQEKKEIFWFTLIHSGIAQFCTVSKLRPKNNNKIKTHGVDVRVKFNNSTM